MDGALFVAAGGGGDVIAAPIVAGALGYRPADTMIASYAWERLLVDPLPGPRTANDLTNLKRLGSHAFEIMPTTRGIAPTRTTLPRLRRATGVRIALLDPTHGAPGMAKQMQCMLDELHASRVIVVDVGGDVLAAGAERGLRSPLADFLALAAVLNVDAECQLVIAGPGVDGELTESEVLDRLADLEAQSGGNLQPADVAGLLSILDWHPTEATALLTAAARGMRGPVEIRDGGVQVPLSDQSATIWRLSPQALAPTSPANDLRRADSFSDAEALLSRRLGFTELDYERHKAAKPAPKRGLPGVVQYSSDQPSSRSKDQPNSVE